MRRGALAALVTAGLLLAGCGGSTMPGGGPAAGSAAPTPAATRPGSAVPTATATRPSRPPVTAPEELRFSGATVDGRRFSGQELAGRPAMLWFWTPWCHICRGEAPEIDAAQRRFGDRVQFVGVPGLGQVGAMQRFVSDTGLGAFPHVVDSDGALWARFGVQAQPAFAFVTAAGRVEVVPGALPADELTARLDRLARG